MLITKKNRLAILSYLFKEGVVVAEKTTGHTVIKALTNHPEIEGVRNLEVIKLMQSLVSKELVTERFSWKHYYWFLKDEGIEYLREYLNIPEDVVPNTLKKSTKPAVPPSGRPLEGEGERRGPPRGDRDDYRRGPPGGGDRPGGGFGGDRPRTGGFGGDRDGGAPRPAGGFGRGGGAPRPPQ